MCTIRSCAAQLERLDPELVPAAMASALDPSNSAAMEHLRLLKAEWTSNVELLVRTIDNVTDARTFVWLSGEYKGVAKYKGHQTRDQKV